MLELLAWASLLVILARLCRLTNDALHPSHAAGSWLRTVIGRRGDTARISV